MVEFRLTINDVKTGKSYKKLVTAVEADMFIGKKIKDKILGSEFGLKDYELEITGGSDTSGFPMRYDLPIPERKKILIVEGIGAKLKRKGVKQRKTVVGNTLSHNISQINLKVVKYGSKSLDEILGKKEEKSGVKE